MKFIFVVPILFILTISIFYYISYRREKATYHKAGKKWDSIVKELSRRK